MALAGSAVLVPCIVLMRETHQPTLQRKAAQATQRMHAGHPLVTSYESRMKNFSVAIVLVRPLRMLCTSRIICLCSCYSALADGYLFIVLTTFAGVYIGTYSFSTAASGLASLGLGLGAVVGHFVYTAMCDRTVRLHQGQGDYRPEHRLLWMPIGAVLMPLGLLWYGWCVDKHVHWIASIIGMFPCGMGLTMIMVP